MSATKIVSNSMSNSTSSGQRRRVALVGATGVAGQQFLVALEAHPWFEVTCLAASPRSAGKRYREAITEPGGALRWGCEAPLPAAFEEMEVVEAGSMDLSAVDLVFSAVESDAARDLEKSFAVSCPVVSTASAFRYEDDVPIVVPGINDSHVALVARQRRERGWQGYIVPIPNCTTTGLVCALAPLQQTFGVRSVVATSLQAMSGAGRSPGVVGMDILDNVIPYIPKEEEKVQKETRKILGLLNGDTIEPLEVAVSATCTRVNVRDGHTVCASVGLGRDASIEQVRECMEAFGREFCSLGLPSAPPELIHVMDDPFRPQPRLDRGVNDGMSAVVGRIRPDGVLPHGIKFVVLSHNTKLGAAKGAVLTAEVLVHRGLA